MNELCLFAGAGGGSIASKWFLGWRTVCYIEIDRYCQQVLEARIRDELLDDAPIWDDVRTFDGQPWRGCVDIVTAGFPCQPFSVAGKRKGADDERNMWPDTIRIIREVRPQYAFLENVPGLLVSGYFGHILGDLAASGYDIRWRCLSAAEVGAPHIRERLWIYCTDIAGASEYASGKRYEGNEKATDRELPRSTAFCSQVADNDYRRFMGEQGIYKNRSEETSSQRIRKNVADANIKRCGNAQERLLEISEHGSRSASQGRYWTIEPNVGRVAHGVASRMDRLKALGNGQVPQVVKVAWELLYEERL